MAHAPARPGLFAVDQRPVRRVARAPDGGADGLRRDIVAVLPRLLLGDLRLDFHLRLLLPGGKFRLT